MISDLFVSVLIPGVFIFLFTQLVESWRTQEENKGLSCFGVVVFFPQAERHYFSYSFEYLSISLSHGPPPSCTSAVFLCIYKSDPPRPNSLFYVHLKKKEDESDPSVVRSNQDTRQYIYVWFQCNMERTGAPDVDTPQLALTTSGSSCSHTLLY